MFGCVPPVESECGFDQKANAAVLGEIALWDSQTWLKEPDS